VHMTTRELWTALHGMVLGAAFLLAFTGGFLTLWDLGADGISVDTTRSLGRRLVMWTWTMAILAWLTCIVGTYVVYPWYRAKAPAGTSGAALIHYPRNLLLSDPSTADWHEFGMEWKEHVAWFTPILATAVAGVVTCCRRLLATDSRLRRTILALYSLAFVTAAIAGVFGALINKVAPTK
jgi:hypothetical protein